MCARFKTFNFNVVPSVTNHQAIIVQDPFWVLASYTGLPCEERYQGCTRVDQNDNKLWKYGGANGYHEGSQFFPVWQPNVWNTVCITAAGRVLNITINQLLVFTDQDYKENHRSVEAEEIVLMNLFDENPMHGMVTDLNIWSRVLSSQEISDWSQCRHDQPGDVLRWEEAELNITDLLSLDLDLASICPESAGEKQTYFSFNMNKTFQETVRFCETMGGHIAVAGDNESLTAMNDVYNATCNPRAPDTSMQDTPTRRRREGGPTLLPATSLPGTTGTRMPPTTTPTTTVWR